MQQASTNSNKIILMVSNQNLAPLAQEHRRYSPSPYDNGLKYCTKCKRFYKTTRKFCEQCNRQLRTTPKSQARAAYNQRHGIFDGAYEADDEEI